MKIFVKFHQDLIERGRNRFEGGFDISHRLSCDASDQGGSKFSLKIYLCLKSGGGKSTRYETPTPLAWHLSPFEALLDGLHSGIAQNRSLKSGSNINANCKVGDVDTQLMHNSVELSSTLFRTRWSAKCFFSFQIGSQKKLVIRF